VTDLVEIVAGRRSKVTSDAPTHDELLPLVQAAGRVADHSSLRPWRLIELRGDARLELARALGKAEGSSKPSSKPLKAPLILAIVANVKKSKVQPWEQEATASGVAHLLSLLLHDAGWGVFWRSSHYTRAKSVRKMHKLEKNEELLGWLYVGGIPANARPGRRKLIDPEQFLQPLHPHALAGVTTSSDADSEDEFHPVPVVPGAAKPKKIKKNKKDKTGKNAKKAVAL
jgi:nitroreductase